MSTKSSSPAIPDQSDQSDAGPEEDKMAGPQAGGGPNIQVPVLHEVSYLLHSGGLSGRVDNVVPDRDVHVVLHVRTVQSLDMDRYRWRRHDTVRPLSPDLTLQGDKG